MPFLPDTNVWISLLKNPGGKLVVKVQAQSISDVFLCSVVKAETLVQRLVPRQCRQNFGGVAGQPRRDGQAEAGEASVQGSGKTGFLFRIGPRHKRFGGWALNRLSGRKEAVQLHRETGHRRSVQRQQSSLWAKVRGNR